MARVVFSGVASILMMRVSGRPRLRRIVGFSFFGVLSLVIKLFNHVPLGDDLVVKTVTH